MSEAKTRLPPRRTMPAAGETTQAAVDSAVHAVETAHAVEAVRTAATAAAVAVAKPASVRHPFAVFDATHAAFAQSTAAITEEIAGLTRTGFDAAAAMLGVRTLRDAMEVNARFLRDGIDTVLAGSLRLTEIGTRFAVEALRTR